MGIMNCRIQKVKMVIRGAVLPDGLSILVLTGAALLDMSIPTIPAIRVV